MKILIVTEDVPVTNLGGAGKHAILLGNALIEAGHEVELLGYLRSANTETNNGFVGKLHSKIDLSNTGLKSVAMGIFNPIRQLLLAWRVWSAIKQLDYMSFDVIHYHGHIAELGILVPKHINYVHTLHDQGSECMTMLRFRNGGPCRLKSPVDCSGCATPKPNLVQKIVSAMAVMLHRKMAKIAFSRHKTIFVSDFLLTRFKQNVGGFNSLKPTVVHNFTDVKTIKWLVNNAPKINHKNLRPTILIAGRVHVTKGQQAFLEEVPNSLLDKIEIRIVGDGPDLSKLKEMHEKRGIKFLGWMSQEDVYKETMLVDACVIPSIWEEPFGASSLEALVLGKKVFSLNQGGTPELARYCNYPNQLELFNDLSSLVKALSLIVPTNTIANINLKADVTERLPEILNVYKTHA
jgi:glycosyltransferase involved in cell wall biosynthesis